MSKQSAKERFKAVRSRMREQGDYTFEPLEREYEYEYERERLSRQQNA